MIDVDKSINIIDCMGTDFEDVKKLINSILNDTSNPVYLITPIASFDYFNASQFKPVWNYTFHLDMDHIDFSNFKPGLGVYELL